ncbi:S26 family signal peptidase [Halarchaeum nitratireducens]|uniref:Signal peptidase I n=1 Tax=Halarchaeum nitratireducens TaxID=489913 RepID=A0A830GE59_9EURY|nr:S26 family signal peptidase [Halarchaeum nitratireducens]GGN22740.1 hypothetical protein GCM10009021_25410 [Halarchaeum nitratireducens]
MTPRRVLSLAGQAFVAVVVLSLIAGQVLGYPVLLGYVTTGSMTGTIDPGDGFIAVPSAVSGDVDEGDVVTFQAQELHGGGLTTHRIVDRTGRGFTTKGDANPFPDQDGGEPPVKRAQIVAHALQVNGHIVTIPHLGTAVMGVRDAVSSTQRQLAVLTGSRSLLGSSGLTYLLFALSFALYLFDVVADRGAEKERERERERERNAAVSSRAVIGVLAAVLVVTATAAMVVPAGTQQYGVVSAEFQSDRPTVIPAGGSSTLTYPVDNGGVVPIDVYLEPASDGVTAAPAQVHVSSRSVVNASVTLHAPPDTGYYRRYVTEYRYLALLPRPVLAVAHDVHPWLPIVLVDAELAAMMVLLGSVLLDDGRIRARTRDSRHNRSLLARIRRALTR